MLDKSLVSDFKTACKFWGGEIVFEREDEIQCDIGIEKLEDELYGGEEHLKLALVDAGNGKHKFFVQQDYVTFGIEGRVDFVMHPQSADKERMGIELARAWSKGKSPEEIKREIERLTRDLKRSAQIPNQIPWQIAELKKILKKRGFLVSSRS